ncbi:MAG: HNH endonuclease family protein [Pseudonocardiaceae bacterium]
MTGRWRIGLFVVVVLAGLIWVIISFAAGPESTTAGSATLRSAVAGLPVAEEGRAGYARERFTHWVDDDRDSCDTRDEVLLAEAPTGTPTGQRCSVGSGQWYSYYDNATWSAPADLDIDHLVPLAEAWDSGASAWTPDQRRAYANDLGDERSLVAVTDNVNQAKADQDPATWLPPYEPARCRYIGEWVAVKLRWRLTVDPAEQATLTTWADRCPPVTITATPAR